MLSKLQGKRRKAGDTSRDTQVCEGDAEQAGCPGVLVKHCSGKSWRGCPAWGSGHCQGISHWRISSLHHTCHSFMYQQPALSGMCHHQSWKDRMNTALQVRSDTASTGLAGQMYQCTKGTDAPKVPTYPTSSWLCHICQLLFAVLGHYRDLAKEGQENPLRWVVTVKFLSQLENAVQETYDCLRPEVLADLSGSRIAFEIWKQYLSIPE